VLKVMSAKVMDFERESKRCCIEHGSDFLACAICGWTRATVERIRAQTGYRRLWDGAWISWSVRATSRQKRC
jgi:hypothetical protein